jgi:phosphohistidine phosphatase
MKRLSLLRHAKASRNDIELEDHARPLTGRGRAQAQTIGDYINSSGHPPQVALCSSSLRTRQTWDEVAARLSNPPPVGFTDRLYHADVEALLAEIASAPIASTHLLVIGHNPGLQELAILLSRRSSVNSNLIAAIAKKFPTAALAVFDFDIESWSEAENGPCSLVSLTTPKLLDR